MLDAPKTLEEARAYRYNKWAGNPEGVAYDEGLCAYHVFDRRSGSYQCRRKNGHGPDGLYCWQHARKVSE